MRVLLQRVTRAHVRVDGRTIGEIGPGYLLFVGIGRGDTPEDADRLAEKVANLRVFADGEGKMNLALADVAGSALVVSQFTLYGETRKGRRPSWAGAADPEEAEVLVERFAGGLERLGVSTVRRGSFGAHMEVELVNDGPVTLLLDSPPEG
jgi:D-tyrosyl-tRNA(Tyr) deacylase